MKIYKKGLVLSGGGARGIAHLGIIKALNEAGFYPDIISGTSSGALVAAFYAAGYPIDEIFNVIMKTKLFSWRELKINKGGLFGYKSIEKNLATHFDKLNFSDLKIPVIIATTDLISGEVRYFTKGKILPVLIASCAIPGFYEPVQVNKYLLTDGGILNNLPVEPIRYCCNFIVGVSVNPVNTFFRNYSLTDIIDRSFHLAIAPMIDSRKKLCNLVIEPPELHKFSIMDIKSGNDIFFTGYEYARKFLKSKSALLQPS